jgi:hypothetical protein
MSRRIAETITVRAGSLIRSGRAWGRELALLRKLQLRQLLSSRKSRQ